MDSRDATQALISSSYLPIGFEEIRFAQVREGFNYWRFLRGGRAFPAREEIEPRAICRLLCNAILLKVIDGGLDFEFGIVGDEVVRAYKAPMARRRLSAVAADLPNSAAYWGRIYRDIVTNRQPWAVRYSVQLDTEACFADAEAVLLPLGPDDQTVDHIITFAKRSVL